jgi:hypothetical protein
VAYTTRFKALEKEDNAILHMDHPCNATELSMFIGCINYYRDMSPSCAHILKPLTDQSGLKKKLLLNGLMKCKKRLTKRAFANALAAYPNHNKRFNVYTDASVFQLGGIIGEGRPVAYFLQKLTKSQQNYITGNRKSFPSLQLSKNFEVCSSVRTFMFLWIIKPDVQYSQNAMCV